MTVAKSPFTDEQRSAIEMRKVSVALSAGAGCGKTFVLTERFLSHLQPGNGDALDDLAGLHQLIAITFTDRAAREMRDRIRSKCFDRLQTAPASDVDYWLRLLRSLDTARISTIHAFCGTLLRSHAVEAKLDPRFTVVEQSQADTLLAELIDDVLRNALAERGPAAMELTVRLGLDRLREMIASLVSYGRTIPFDDWLTKSPADLVAIWDRFRSDNVLPSIVAGISNGPAAKELLQVICFLGDVSGELKKRCQTLAASLPNLTKSKNLAADLEAILQAARVQGAGTKKTWPDETLYERFKAAAETVRSEVKWAFELLQFDQKAAEADASAGLQLLSLVSEVLKQYEARKQELAWLDFNDLLIRARELLVDPQHADLQKRLASQTRLLLVDEFQDTDPVQVDLIKALCGPRLHKGQLFFVGDYKQSIYRFRGADPSVFRQLQRETPKPGQLPLTKNFRSQPAILDFVNALFCDALSSADDEAMQYEPLRAHHSQVTPTPAIEFLWANCADLKKGEVGAKAEARRRDADHLARRIRQMLDHGELLVRDIAAKDRPQARPVQPKDIAVLFRALSDVQYYEEALRTWGIDYYLVGGHAFYAQQEIYDVMNLLRSLASSADEISLAGVLRGPMFALTDETLYWLSQHEHGLAFGLFDESVPASLSDEQRERTAYAAKTMSELRQLKDRLPIAALLNEAMRRTAYDAALLAEFMGERKLANLRKLIDQARSFDQSGVLGLTDFIVQLSQFVVRQPREPLAATHPEGTNVVRLMTIHQSKGLEFPVVFVPDLDRASHGVESGAVWNPQLGPLVKLPLRRDNEAHLTGLDLHNALASLEDEAERLRLLYVATTRAADYLVLSSGVFDIHSPTSPWMKLLASRFDLETGRCSATLPDGYPVPGVKVSLEPPELDAVSQAAHTWNDLDTKLKQVVKKAAEISTGAKRRTSQNALDLSGSISIDHAARQRFSVSRLSGVLQQAEEFAATVMPVEEDQGPSAAGGADLGTLVHAVLAKLNFAEPNNASKLVNRLAELQGHAMDEHVESAEMLISAFTKSARAKELAQATQIHRELEFLLAWPPESNPTSTAKCRYLQGFIDCIYQNTDGGWHLIDFKTNQIAAEGVENAAKQYEMQLGVYALAIEQVFGQPPVECIVHFLRPGKDYRFEWNREMRLRTIERVDQAITASLSSPEN